MQMQHCWMGWREERMNADEDLNRFLPLSLMAGAEDCMEVDGWGHMIPCGGQSANSHTPPLDPEGWCVGASQYHHPPPTSSCDTEMAPSGSSFTSAQPTSVLHHWNPHEDGCCVVHCPHPPPCLLWFFFCFFARNRLTH